MSMKYDPAFLVFLKILPHAPCGSLTLIMDDGTRHHAAGPQNGPHAIMHVHNTRWARRALFGGALAFCESYLDKDWSTPNLSALFEWLLINQQSIERWHQGKWWARMVATLAHRLQPNTRAGSARNIKAHYDLGNDFYQSWLDSSMTYSSALYANPDDNLEAAQMRKYTRLAEKLDLQPHHHILEIGCGWGGFAEFVARTIGARVTGITISPAQYDFAKERIAKAGLADRVDIQMRDYRDVTGHFDRIASIEMFEAVGEDYWPTYFTQIRNRLKQGGRAALQIITIDDAHFPSYRRSADYIQRYIFPGGMLPSPSILQNQIHAANLRLADTLSFGRDYARTLMDWNTRFQSAWPALKTQHGFDERFKRIWEQYLHYCAAGFNVGTIDVMQLALIRD